MEAVSKTTKAMIMTVREAETWVSNARLIQTVSRIGGPTLKQLTFDCKYQKSPIHYVNSK